MKFKFFLLLLITNSTITFSQEFTSVSKGTIVIITGQKYNFINLKKVDSEIEFTNTVNRSKVIYLLNAVDIIEDENHAVIYKRILPPKTPEQIAYEKELKEKNKDTIFKSNYPEGIYITKESFINKIPDNTEYLFPLAVNDNTFSKTASQNCFFYYTETDAKVKRVFAISYKGYLYFQIDAILSNRNKTDRAQTNDYPNSFVRVIMGGENYYYTEVQLANQWAQGFAYGAVGGAAGGALARTMVYEKGTVWDIKKQEFNIFKNCDDYNDFIEKIDPNGVQNCMTSRPDISKIRNSIFKIK